MFNVTGTIVNVLPPKTGTGSNGNPWKVQMLSISTQMGDRKVNLAFSVWNSEQDITLPRNTKVSIDFYAQTRDVNGKYFTNLNAMNIKVLEEPDWFKSQSMEKMTKQPYVPQQPETPEQSTSDLPF